MGLAYVDAVVENEAGDSRTVRFLVDSGASYSLLPHEDWTALGLEPQRRVPTLLADGSVVERDVSEARFVLPQGRAFSPVFLGEPGDNALLGAITLENLGLVLNPFTRTLHPMRMLLT